MPDTLLKVLNQYQKELSDDIATDVAEKVYSRLINEIKKLLPKPKRTRLSRKQVSILKRESLVTVDRKARSGIYKKYKDGGRFFFYEDEVLGAYVEMEA